MKNEELKKKLEKLSMLYQQLKALRDQQGEEFSPEDEDLLSHAELLEEALKNYMYQFGLSIYRNKKGKRFFKKFIHDEDEVRGFDELEPQCFEFVENRPNFLQRLLEYKPADRLLMNYSIEDTVDNLYTKDPAMVEVLDELVNEESQHYMSAIYNSKLDAQIEKTFDIKNEINTPQIDIKLNAPDIAVSDIEKEFAPAKQASPQKRAKITKKSRGGYGCGKDNVKKKSPTKARTTLSKDNTNER